MIAGIRTRRQCVLSIEERLGRIVVNEEPAIDGVLVARHIVDAADPLIVRVVRRLAEEGQAARIG